MKIENLPGVGAEISDVDIRKATAGEMDAIKQSFADHGIIFFRGQDINEDDHIAFAERWGEINVNRFFAAHPDYPQIAMVAKEKDQKDNIGGGWHTDHSYDVIPALGSILVARELPETGGDTLFASMYAALEALPDDLRQKIEGKRAIHSVKHIFGSGDATHYNQSDAKGERIGNSDVADTMTDVLHSAIIKHPLSGKDALYVNPGFTVGIEGYDEAEGKALLKEIFSHAIDKAHTHRFEWQPGSIAFWDNRATWHWALNDYHGQRRVMHRITLEGCALN
jgi:taurine dioxygenase